MKRRSPDSTGEKQENTRFKPGQSGNPAGRPKNVRNKATVVALALLEGEAEALSRKLIEMALAGNIIALRLCLERLVPPAKERPVAVNFLEVQDASGLARFTGTLLAAVGNGDIDPGQAASVARIVETHRNVLELAEIEMRLKKVEETMNEKRN